MIGRFDGMMGGGGDTIVRSFDPERENESELSTEPYDIAELVGDVIDFWSCLLSRGENNLFPMLLAEDGRIGGA